MSRIFLQVHSKKKKKRYRKFLLKIVFAAIILKLCSNLIKRGKLLLFDKFIKIKKSIFYKLRPSDQNICFSARDRKLGQLVRFFA